MTAGEPTAGSQHGRADRRVRIGMALYGDLTFDSRVRREAAALARAGHAVTLVCLAGEAHASDLPEGVHVVVHRPARSTVLPGTRARSPVERRGRLRSVLGRVSWLKDYFANLRSWGRALPELCGDVDAWHLHDLTALAGVLPAIRRGVPVVYDAHELFLESGTAAAFPASLRRLLRAYERRLVSRVAAVVTVNDALAAAIQQRYRPARSVVVHNCPERWSPPSTPPDLIRAATGIPGGSPVILYHGVLAPGRGIEQLMETLLRPGLEDAHLALLGPGAQRATYVELARDARWADRVHVLDPVPPTELLPWVASADVGAMPIQDSTLNHFLSTPNKLFECLAAGVPVVASDFPAMRGIVTGDPAGALGALCDPASVDDVAAALRSIFELDPAAMADLRARCLAAARDHWNWETESARLVALYRDLVPTRAD